MVDQIEALVGIEVGDLNVRHQAVLNMLHQHYHDPPHAMQTATLALQLFDQLRPLHGLPAQAASFSSSGCCFITWVDTGRSAIGTFGRPR
jgi:hypothetical protein